MLAMIMDWLPILGFFVTYKIAGIYYATGAIMIATAMQVMTIKFILNKKVELINWGVLALVMLMGSLTLLFHNDNFIKWKPTVLYIAFAAAFFITPIVKQSSLVEIMLASKVTLAKKAWQLINNCFIVFFLLMSILNTYVFLNYSTETWVNFKLFGTLAITLVFMLTISLLIMRNKKN